MVMVERASHAASRPGVPVTAPRLGWRAARPILALVPFRRLVGGQVFSQAADGLAQITFAQVVLFEAGSGATPWEITKLLLVTVLPYSLVGPFAGVLIDRYDRRRVMVVASVVRAAVVAASVLVLVLDSQALAYAAALLLVSTGRFVLAAKGAALPNTVGEGDLVTANALSSLAGMTAAFLGAVVGSAFVAIVPAVGFVLAAAAYGFAARLFGRLPDVGGGEPGDRLLTGLRRVTGELADGLRVVVRQPAIRRPLVAVTGNRLLLGAGFILLVLVADDRYDLEAPGYGLALAVTGIGAFGGTWLAPLVGRRYHRLAVLPLLFLVGAIAAAVGAFDPRLGVLVAGVGAVAFAFQILKVLVDALLQEASTDDVRGRVFSIHDVLYNVAFILAGLALVPLWEPGREEDLLRLLAVAFGVVGGLLALAQGSWPFHRRALERDTVAVPHRWPLRLLAVPLGAVPALSFPALSWWPVGFVGLVPLLVLVVLAPTRRAAGWRSWFGGAGFFFAMHHWLVPSVGPFAVPIALALGVLWLPWGWLAWALLHDRPDLRQSAAALVLVPSAWVVAESLRSWERLGGPWGLLGAGQWQNHDVLALAALGGVWLVGFVLVAVSVAVTILVLPRSAARTRAAAIGATALLLLGAFATGWMRADASVTSTVRIGGVQPGVIHGPEARFDAHLELTRQLSDEDLDLVVWGESSVGFDLQEEPEAIDRLTGLSREVGAPVLVNVDARRGETGIFKSSVLVGATGAEDRYDKMRLVPFGEYVPLRSVMNWVTSVTDAAGEDRLRGDDLVVMDVGATTIGPLVCFESAFPDLSRELADRGASVLVPQTATTTFQGSWAQPQHASLGAVRAVETGRSVVHGSLSGVSAIFDPDGHRLAWLSNHDTGVYLADVPVASGVTPYVRLGDWVPLASLVALLLAALVTGLRQARRCPRDSGR